MPGDPPDFPYFLILFNIWEAFATYLAFERGPGDVEI